MKTAEELAREAGIAEFGGCTEANIERLIAIARSEALEDIAQWLAVQRNDVPATGKEFANALRALKGQQ